MYVEDIEDGKRTYTMHIFAHNFLNIHPYFQSEKSFGNCLFMYANE